MVVFLIIHVSLYLTTVYSIGEPLYAGNVGKAEKKTNAFFLNLNIS